MMQKKLAFAVHLIGILTLLAFSLSACVAPTRGISQSTTTATAPHGSQHGVKVSALPVNRRGTDLWGGLIEGPDKNLWFSEGVGKSIMIAKLTLAGQLTEFAVPNDSQFGFLSVGSDGNIWFGGGSSFTHGFIGRITPDGQISEFALPHAGDLPGDMTLGADGNIWFAIYQDLHTPTTSVIGRITPAGAITEFTLPHCASNVFPDDYTQIFGITVGPDGNVWYDLTSSPACGAVRVDSITSKGTVSIVSILDEYRSIQLMARGPRDTVWLTQIDQSDNSYDATSKIVCIGCIAGSEIPKSFDMPKRGQIVVGLVMGPDGNMWFTGERDVDHSSFVGNITPSGQITTYPLLAYTKPQQPVLGSDNALYFIDDAGNQIERVQVLG